MSPLSKPPLIFQESSTAEKASLKQMKSFARISIASGLCTLTATSTPSCVFALYTWPKEATAIGDSEMLANKGGTLGSSDSLMPTPGATGPVQLSDSFSTAHAKLSSKATLEVCSRLSSVAASSPTISGRWDKVCEIFTLIGPSDATVSHSLAPRSERGTSSSLTSSMGLNSSDVEPLWLAASQSANAFRIVEVTSKKREKTSCGRWVKKAL
mmetsp:Transcript_94852/g.178470  ORF Transcript_94852/g.178470 Transcript_94852/m.178470 type:complete len:212 (+) Transcript_94852:1746-2381(+)